MKSRTNSDFWTCFNSLPVAIQQLARDKYRIFKQDHFHPSLHFKLIRNPIWSIRINQQYRAIGLRHEEEIIWFWIGTHAEYDRLLS